MPRDFGAAIAVAAAFARTPEWARFPPVDPLGAASPMLALAFYPMTGVVMSTAIVMTALRAISAGAQRLFPGALAGSVAAAVLVLLLSWGWFRVLRRPFQPKHEAA